MQFITPGHVLGELQKSLIDASAAISDISRYLIVTQLLEQQYTKLEQAGSNTDNRPGIQRLFTDLPYYAPRADTRGSAASDLMRASARNHSIEELGPDLDKWRQWQLNPSRARVWFVKGGPGQGKSTLTQYVAQIHRACLILDKDGPNVTPPQKAIAEEIKAYAEAAGLWPLAPRIPVVVELKEFAQWYGRLSPDTSKRVIAYLVHRLSTALAQTVLSGTLTRAFSSARWLFIFDGLDEVPGDSKDAIAGEVNHFVDDVLIGLKSDAQIICTSRPQGYSGQFNGISAATVVLSLLTPDQALACANPVLSIDRSESEASNYKAMLREAISSVAVREIMTTPLQSHIMAIVVRDGGRPPERKWQLFSNFYSTIKRREATRNLPDKKIAALLREEDQLLKAIHNCLGFTLHTRAELSKTAVTSLGRLELESLVRRVVEELKERDIEGTVKLLMEATTDRLVLVNTPESGSEVRFDIRQLQEFFAAELIYDTASITRFVERVRIICGDSHWREVMHFLLSGLIENNRKGELANAVDVLADLNRGGDRVYAQALYRRLGLGSYISARLLQEGVLEQDRRVRALFRETLLPLLASTSALQMVGQIRPAQSAAWFSELVIDVLIEQAESERIGAAIIATQLISENHGRFPEMIAAIRGSSLAFRSCMLLAANGAAGHHTVRGQSWSVGLTLEILLSDDWLNLEAESIEELRGLLQADQKVTARIAKSYGLSQKLISILPALLGPYRYRPYRSDPEDVETHCGILEARYEKRHPALSFETWPKETWEELAGAKGYFKICYLALQFLKTRSKGSAAALLKSVGGTPEGLEYLPWGIRDFFNTDIKLTADSKNWIRSDRPGQRVGIMLSRQTDRADWTGLATRYPYIMVHFISEMASEPMSDSAKKFVSTANGVAVFLEGIKRQPDALTGNVGGWGQWVSLPETGPILRAALLQYAGNKINPRYPSYLSTFALELPKEESLLPHIIAYVTVLSTVRGPESPNSELPPAQRFRDIVGRYIPNRESLICVLRNSDRSERVRAAAMVAFLAHPARGPSDDLPSAEELVEMYRACGEKWFIPAINLSLSDAVYHEREGALAIAGALIDASRSDYETRRLLDPVLHIWQEYARSPVNDSDQKIWVGH